MSMRGKVCIDASLAVMWVLPDPLMAEARRVRTLWALDNVLIMAPPLFRPELTSSIRRWVYTGALNQEDGRRMLESALRLPVYISDAGDALQRRAFDVAAEIDQPRAYDAQYMALAEFNGCELWTGDKRLVNSAQSRFSWLRWIGDFQSV